MYNILLNKLVLNPDVEEITEQLFKEHPQILKEEKISKEKIAQFVRKIQIGLDLDFDDYELYEEDQPEDEEQHEPHHHLNRSN